MTTKDLAEIKRRLNPDHRHPTMLRGCYFTPRGEIISTFARPVAQIPDEENEKYMALFRRSLSGTIDRNLCAVDFPEESMVQGEGYALLTGLCATALREESLADRYFHKMLEVIPDLVGHELQSVEQDEEQGNFLLLVLHDEYDIPYHNMNDEVDEDRQTDVFNYVLTCICPVKQGKSTLSYFAAESEFHNRPAEWTVGMPELGLMFPVYEEHGGNVSRALVYTRKTDGGAENLVDKVLEALPRMSAAEQTEAVQAMLQDSLDTECSMNVIRSVHETIGAMITEQKEDKEADPLALTGKDMKNVLESCGVSEEKAEVFRNTFEENFGTQAAIPAVNILSPKEFKVQTPNVSIKVDPAHSDLVETRMIDGKYYILVLADGDVEVNGMRVTC